MFFRKSPRLSRRRRRAARSARRRAFPCAVTVVFEHPCGPGGAGTGEGCRFLDFEFNRIKKDSFLRFYFPLVLRAISTKERCSESVSKTPRRNLSTGHSRAGLISKCDDLISESLTLSEKMTASKCAHTAAAAVRGLPLVGKRAQKFSYGSYGPFWR